MKPRRRQQIAEEVRRLARPPALRDDEITIRQYADANDMTYNEAQTELANAFEAGDLQRRKVLHKGKRKWAYSVQETDQQPPKGDPHASPDPR